MEAFLLKLASSAGGTGVAIAALWIIYKIVMARQMRKFEEVSAQQPPITTPAMGLPMLGGTNPAAGEISNVMSDPMKIPITQGEHENLCGERQKVIGERLSGINTKLSDTNDRINRVDTKLSETARTMYAKLDKTNEAMNSAVTELKAGVAVIKDRTNRGG